MTLIAIVLIAAAAWTGISYPTMAAAKAWPKGKWWDSTWWGIYFGFAMLTLSIAAFKAGGMLYLVAGLILGWLVAFLLTLVAGPYSRFIALLSLPVAVVWSASLGRL